MSTQAPSAPVLQAWVHLVRAQTAVLGAVEADLKKAGLPPLAWYDVLLELHRAEGMALRPLEIEGRLLLPQHNVSRLLDRLERAGHVSRQPHPTDGRGQVIHLSASGEALLRTMWPVYRAAISRHLGAKLRGDAEAEQLARLLGQLIGAQPPDSG